MIPEQEGGENRQARLEAARAAISQAVQKIRDARVLPVHESLINASWRLKGFALILLSRRQPDGKLLFGYYYVDLLCMGLKNTFCNADLSRVMYRELKRRTFSREPPIDCPLALARAIIYGAIAYARQFEFEPNVDFMLTRSILEDVDEVAPWPDQIPFGRQGKPLFIAGPGDDVKGVLRKLESKLGKGNFDTLGRM